MSATAPEFDTDDEREAREERESKAAANREGFADRKARQEAEREELEELRQFKAQAERSAALDKAKADLNPQGPFGAFLKVYDGDPTPDAIRKAVESDDEWKALITFTPDPRDEAARVQADHAAKVKGAAPVGSVKPNSDVAPGLARLEAAHAARASKT